MVSQSDRETWQFMAITKPPLSGPAVTFQLEHWDPPL